ncbi:putative transcription factor NAM family [Lupinus albus]|uniref:Putative transcription factor NAM family n=1 Tax=Lupinus albus TaxID=3870 RepID=A0A6A4R7X5_LUPAL|nr:putative transcription factor NAM family [Lupinus albus]
MENMAAGYRFYPTEEELISFYLHNKLEGEKEDIMNRVIPLIDIYSYNPSQLPRKNLSFPHFFPFIFEVILFHLLVHGFLTLEIYRHVGRAI